MAGPVEENEIPKITEADIPTPSVFIVPQREIFAPKDMSKWEKSEAYHEYLGFVLMLNSKVKGLKMLNSQYPSSDTIQKLVEMLDKMSNWIDEIPPMEQPQRFGNKSFRTWFDKLKIESEDLLKEVLPPEFHEGIKEFQVYLVEGVGNYTRIDYGTGHEMSFLMFLCCLYKIKALKEEDAVATVFQVFNRYLILMRKLQLTYRMEPAGSHGVWSLDDYQFLPFIFGSSQLIGNRKLSPKSFPNEDLADAYAKDYMFMGCIQFIHKVKTGPFAEHSNQLWNISGVPDWDKVSSGLIRMYKAEILAKFPVIQHVLFGSLLPIKQAENSNLPEHTTMGPPAAVPLAQGVHSVHGLGMAPS